LAKITWNVTSTRVNKGIQEIIGHIWHEITWKITCTRVNISSKGYLGIHDMKLYLEYDAIGNQRRHLGINYIKSTFVLDFDVIYLYSIHLGAKKNQFCYRRGDI
jgi:hypothetical protein